MVVKIGVLGGTFDPVHNGHLKIAEEALRLLGLAEVLMVPAGQPLLKPPHPITPAEHRLKMLQLATEASPYFKVSTIEIDRPGPSYTVETISALKNQYGDGFVIYFIIGCDTLAKLHEWKDPARLVSMCRLAVVPRPGYRRPGPAALEKKIPGISQKLTFLDSPRTSISASKIRAMAARGISIRGLVPAPVDTYIKQHGLYKTLQEVQI
jgi:nicotinate-nucleotide adenylyltransferase